MFAINLKSSKTKEKCQKWHLTFELKFEMSQNKLRCQWHLKLFLKCHGQQFTCHKCHKCHKKKDCRQDIKKKRSRVEAEDI